ncbi:MAG: hypothetical protein Q8L48_00565 [Archangium sp.]|nr:hypothetical protein [Archangium sp.]
MSLLVLVVLAGVDALPPSPSVILEAVDCPEALTAAIRDELEVAGFPTLVASRSAPQVASVIARCTGDQVVTRIEDRITSKSVERTLAWTAGPRSEVLVAIQVVELLHASLAETRFAALTHVPLPVERFLAEREPTPPTPWEFSAAGGVMFAPGGFGVQPAVSAEVSRAVSSSPAWRLEFGAALAATVHATVLRSTGGQADVGLVESCALAAAAFERGGWTARPRVSLGVLLVWGVGRAGGDYGAASGATATFEVGLALSLARAVTSWLSVKAGLGVAVTPFPVQVRLPDATTSIGLPVLSAQLGVVFR